jgi:hypothetical protein
MNRTLATLFLALMTSVVAAPPEGTADTLPPAPKGFAWREVDDLRSAFLVPSGWYFKRGAPGSAAALFITRENIDEQGYFDTGLSLNVFERADAGDAVERARQYIASRKAAAEKSSGVMEVRAGKHVSLRCATTNVDPNDKRRFRMVSLAVANTETQRLYVLWFESLEEQWEEQWKIGEVILDGLQLDRPE